MLQTKVYDRFGLPCVKCKAPIKQIVQGQRSTYFCSKCQKK
jgi:formamidopyrimidine-DNA glycosylase